MSAETGPKKAIQLKLILEREHGIKYSSILGKSKRHARSAIKVQDKGEDLIIEITAKDLTALRASANSVLRDLQVIAATKI
jgi:tRNA threonylcarbamoyladenosine modification (KEOPS) complex  Pcc1 subunit